MNFKHGIFDALNRYKSTEVDRRTLLNVPSGTAWSTSSDTHQVVEILKETYTKMYTPFKVIPGEAGLRTDFFQI